MSIFDRLQKNQSAAPVQTFTFSSLPETLAQLRSLPEATLDPGEYLVIPCTPQTTGFALSASGRDSIQLQDPAGNIISQVKLRAVPADQVMAGR